MIISEIELSEAIKRYEILDTPAEACFDSVTRFAAQLFDVPIALITIVEKDRIWFKSRYGLDLEEVPRFPGLCGSAVEQNAPLIIENTIEDIRSSAHPLVAGENGFRFYGGAPLETPDHHLIGTICILDFEPRIFSPRQADMLQQLGRVVMDVIEMRLSLIQRAVAAEARVRETA